MIIPRAAIATALALTAASSTSLTLPDLRADTNRDGVVDITGTTDSLDKTIWTRARGAIFLPNIGDTLGRCSDVDALGQPLTNAELAQCNDASGDTAFSPEYFAPLRAMPLTDVSDVAFAHVATYPENAAPHVRIFWQQTDGGIWTYIDPEFRFDAAQIRAGLKLGLDSRHLVTDAEDWDGSVKIRLTVFDGDVTESDEVAMKLAPLLFHHHLQNVETLITQLSNDSMPSQKRFVSQLEDARVKTNVKKPIFTLPENDIWAQDVMEPGYSSMPGPDGKPISVRIIVRTAQHARTAGRQVFTKLRGKGVGGFQPLGKGTFGFREINSGGNIETIPPYTSKVTGEEFPAGRIITGSHDNLLPAESMLKFYNSQQLQKPLLLESGWLMIGHVDEFLSFLPANNSLGFTISIADPMKALHILQKANTDGYGNTPAYSVGPNIDPDTQFGSGPNLNTTIADVLASNTTSIEVQQYAAKYIDQNLAVLLAETGLDESEVIRIPTLFSVNDLPFTDGFSSSDPVGSPPHYTVPPPGGMVLLSFYPAAVNGVVIGNSYICANAYGSVINGTDIFQEAVADAYKKAGMNAYFIDDFYSHHIGGGDVHCGSNTLRETAVKWW